MQSEADERSLITINKLTVISYAMQQDNFAFSLSPSFPLFFFSYL